MGPDGGRGTSGAHGRPGLTRAHRRAGRAGSGAAEDDDVVGGEAFVAGDSGRDRPRRERGLAEEGHAVDVARTGEDALWMARSVEYDAIVLDLMLPGMNGIEVCCGLRESEVWSPVLMLTARDAVSDRVAGLDAGADDYLPKPFSFVELLARLRSLARRGQRERPAVLEAGGPTLRWVRLGAARGDRVEVLSGLQGGERLVVTRVSEGS